MLLGVCESGSLFPEVWNFLVRPASLFDFLLLVGGTRSPGLVFAFGRRYRMFLAPSQLKVRKRTARGRRRRKLEGEEGRLR